MTNTIKYLALDTNIFVSFFETGFEIILQDGTSRNQVEQRELQSLLETLDDSKVELILPEIVILESQRIQPEKQRDLDKIYGDAIENVKKAECSPDKKISEKSIEQIGKNILKICEEEKRKNAEIDKLLSKIFRHQRTHVVKLSEADIVSAYKKGLMGEKPYEQKFALNKKPIYDIQPDCIIVESLKSFLKNKKNFELYLCTNDSHFFTSNDKSKIDDCIQKELKLKDYAFTISDLLNKAIGKKVSVKKEKIKNKEVVNAYPIMGKSVLDQGEEKNDTEVARS